MSPDDRLLRVPGDTARWVAMYRALESERPDALFRDPFAARLGGERGERIFRLIGREKQQAWAYAMRTLLFDQLVSERVAEGADLVINLAAGMDARPYRMELPASLRWVEVDLPEILDEKARILAGERPVCRLEQVRTDLADREARRELFGRLGSDARDALILSEGLLIYFSPEEVGQLAEDLAGPPAFHHWAIDVASPGLVEMINRQVGRHMAEADLNLQFGPTEGPGFFRRFGWEPVSVQSVFKTAARLRRLAWWMRLMARLPESTGEQGKRPWSAVCLLARRDAAGD